MRTRSPWVVALICAIIAPSVANASLTAEVSAVQRTVRDGLAHNAVNAMAQTRDGYLWLATQEGLSRCDGVRCVTFDPASTPALHDSFFQALALAPDGSLITATWGGGMARYQDGAWMEIAPSNDALKEATQLAVTPDGVIWAGTGNGLYSITGATVRRWSVAEGLASNDVRALAVSEAGALWVGTANGGIDVIHGGAMVERYRHVDGQLPGAYVTALARGPNGSMLAGVGLDLVTIADRRCSSRRVLTTPGDSILALGFDAERGLWIGTLLTGLYRVSETEVISATPGLTVARTIRGLMLDREGTLWVATDGWGIVALRPRDATVVSAQEGLPSPIVWAALEAPDGTLWAGTEAGLVRLTGTGVPLRTFGVRDGFSSDFTSTIAALPDGTVFAGSEEGQLRRIDPLGRVRTAQLTPADQGAPIRSITLIDPQTLAIASSAGVILVDPATLRVTRRFGADAGLPNTGARTIAGDRKRGVWIATDTGLYKLFADSIQRATLPSNAPDDLAFSVSVDEDGAVWAATRSMGIVYYHQGILAHFTTKHGLHHNVIYAIRVDANGMVWMTSSHGVARIPRAALLDVARGAHSTVTADVFADEAGFRSRECNGGRAPALWVTRDGRVLAPTMDGLVILPGAIERTSIQRNVPRIEEVQASVPARTQRERLAFPPSDGRLRIRYTVPTFVDATQVRFRTQLLGFDPAWVDAGTAREAAFTNLPPGTYTFRVEALIPGLVEPIPPATVSFTLEPYFTQTTGFRIVLIILGALAVMGFIRLRTYQLRSNQRALEAQVAERTVQLHDANATLAEQAAQLTEANRRLEELSRLDGLTGIPNRRAFDAFLDHEWKRATREQKPLTVLMLDVDYFKRLNDAIGHMAGDECLRKIASAMQQALRGSDFIARYGGEEFSVILPSTDLEGGRIAAEKVRARVEAIAIPHPNSSLGPCVTVSIGVATVESTNESAPDTLILRADHALYAAKRSGRNRVVTSQ